MKRIVPALSLLIILGLCYCVHSQTPPAPVPDFGGHWAFEAIYGPPDKGFRDDAGRPLHNKTEELYITQKGSDVEIVFESTVQGHKIKLTRLYHVDGSGEVNPSDWMTAGELEISSVSSVKNGVLIIDSELRDIKTKQVKFKYKDTWQLSKNGKKLIRKVPQPPLQLDFLAGDHLIHNDSYPTEVNYKLIT